MRRAPWVMALAILVAACGPRVEHEGDPALEATVGISPTPPMTGEAEVLVRATDDGRDLPRDATVAVEVGGVQVPMEPGEGGGTWVGLVPFPAAGEETLTVLLRLPDGRSAVQRFPVTVTRRPGGG